VRVLKLGAKAFIPVVMATSILGGYLGARYGRKVKQQYIRYFVIAVGFSLAAWYFYQQFFAPVRVPPSGGS